MKNLITLTAAVLAMSSPALAQEGPLVSGGMPLTITCGAKKDLYQVTLKVLGDYGGGTVVKATPTGFLPIPVECHGSGKVIGAGMITAFSCNSEDANGFVQLTKNTEDGTYTALVFDDPSGVPDPIVIPCK